MHKNNGGLREKTKKITCPNKRCHARGEPKCRTKVTVVLGSKDNGDVWEIKDIKCPQCNRIIRYKVNNHRGKIKVLER